MKQNSADIREIRSATKILRNDGTLTDTRVKLKRNKRVS